MQRYSTLKSSKVKNIVIAKQRIMTTKLGSQFCQFIENSGLERTFENLLINVITVA